VTVDRDWLRRPALELAPLLLGALVVSDLEDERVAVRLTEVEAYEGADDPASHAYRGRTPRTAVMFGPAGHLYCYFTYGMHWCANIVCGLDGVASAVLLRAGAVVTGVEAARRRRPASRRDIDLARGPARLASCLGLAAEQNGVDLCDSSSPVRLEPPVASDPASVVAGPRVGISSATDRNWRFSIAGDPTVSVFKAGGRKRVVRGPAD
jgi:DNA-3-methyladenine glycosylase